MSLLTRLLLPLPPVLLLLPQSVLLPAGSTLLVSRNDLAMERTLEDTWSQLKHIHTHMVWETVSRIACYLVAVLSLTQLSIAQWSSAVMADRSEAPREGDVSAPALCQELLVLHLLFHLSMNPELMLRG